MSVGLALVAARAVDDADNCHIALRNRTSTAAPTTKRDDIERNLILFLLTGAAAGQEGGERATALH
jgi:hypothetical protein